MSTISGKEEHQLRRLLERIFRWTPKPGWLVAFGLIVGIFTHLVVVGGLERLFVVHSATTEIDIIEMSKATSVGTGTVSTTNTPTTLPLRLWTLPLRGRLRFRSKIVGGLLQSSTRSGPFSDFFSPTGFSLLKIVIPTITFLCRVHLRDFYRLRI